MLFIFDLSHRIISFINSYEKKGVHRQRSGEQRSGKPAQSQTLRQG
jgi:hypothetical protein